VNDNVAKYMDVDHSCSLWE